MTVAAAHPDIAEEIGAYLKTARADLPEWDPRWQPPKKPKPQKP